MNSLAFCVEFERTELTRSIALYKYGNCGKTDGLFELNYEELEQIALGLFNMEISLFDVVRVVKTASNDEDFGVAIRAFTAIMRHYKEHKVFLSNGGYYA